MIETAQGTPENEPNEPQVYSLNSLIADATADAEARREAFTTGALLGPRTAIPKLTEVLGGSLAPGVHILHGSPGSGKTAFALQTACTAGCPALFVTCEMGPIELLRRIAARVTGVYLGRFKTGELTPDQARGYFEQAAESAPQLIILDASKAALPPVAFQKLAQRAREQSTHFLIVIDSVHAWASGWQSTSTEYDTLNEALDEIRKTAARLDVPALCIAERNRASMKEGGQSASAGTRRFEYGAESVIELHRKENDEAPDAYGDTIVTVKVSKNRHGAPAGKIELLFNGRTQAFRQG